MNPYLLQKQLRNNISDLDEFYKNLKTWGETMKEKDQSLKAPKLSDQLSVSDNKKENSNKTKKVSFTKNDKPQRKLGSTDYSAWDKFDADAECEKVDYNENEDSSLTDECDETLRDQAYVEKEKGNKFVKEKKWNEAIECYTKAVDCYGYDPIFYANRALCFLKVGNPEKAESDCTLSLKLDQKYVKAYQRRAAAREAQNKLAYAESDLLKVLEFEPNNKESRKCLEQLREKMKATKKPEENVQRPISKFMASRNQKGITTPTLFSNSSNIQNKTQPLKIPDTSKPISHWPSGDDNLIPVRTIEKPVHRRSKKPLRRLEIEEIDDEVARKKNAQSVIIPNNLQAEEKTSVSSTTSISKETKNTTNCSRVSEKDVELVPPKTSVQFYSQWKCLKTQEKKCDYLKLIKPQELPNIFKESLDSDLFSAMLEVLVNFFIKNGGEVFNFLYYLTEIKRFSAFTIFMSSTDKNYLWKLLDYIKQHENKSKEEVDLLIKRYEL